MTIQKIYLQNVEALVRQQHKPLLDIVSSYENSEDVTEMVEAWRGFGTTSEAIKHYLENNVKQTPKPKRSATKKAGK